MVRRPDGGYDGVEAVIDKDHSSALIARNLNSDALLLLTDVDGVYREWGRSNATRIDRLNIWEIASGTFAAGSMEPKVRAAADFVQATGRHCGIGRLEDAAAVLEGKAGTAIIG